jgi:hypothetical protein
MRSVLKPEPSNSDQEEHEPDAGPIVSDRRMWAGAILLSLILAVGGCMGPVVISSITNPDWDRGFDPSLLLQTLVGGLIIGLGVGVFGGAGARQNATKYRDNPGWYRQQWQTWTLVYAFAGAIACVIMSMLFLTFIS